MFLPYFFFFSTISRGVRQILIKTYIWLDLFYTINKFFSYFAQQTKFKRLIMFTSVFGLVLVLILIKFYIFFFIHLNRSECFFPSIFHFVFYTDFFSPFFLYRIFFRSMNRLQGTLKKIKTTHFFRLFTKWSISFDSEPLIKFNV